MVEIDGHLEGCICEKCVFGRKLLAKMIYNAKTKVKDTISMRDDKVLVTDREST